MQGTTLFEQPALLVRVEESSGQVVAVVLRDLERFFLDAVVETLWQTSEAMSSAVENTLLHEKYKRNYFIFTSLPIQLPGAIDDSIRVPGTESGPMSRLKFSPWVQATTEHLQTAGLLQWANYWGGRLRRWFLCSCWWSDRRSACPSHLGCADLCSAWSPQTTTHSKCLGRKGSTKVTTICKSFIVKTSCTKMKHLGRSRVTWIRGEDHEGQVCNGRYNNRMCATKQKGGEQ